MVYSTPQPSQPARKKIRIHDLIAFKKAKRLITSITCYDSTFARLLEKSNIDFVLVGDSLGHVMQGDSTTLKVTVEDVAYHTRCVASHLKTPLLVSDMPFGAAGLISAQTFRAAETLMRAGAEAVKIEGATEEVLREISVLTRHGIPVMGHIGLIPQSVHAIGGYRVQGKTEENRQRLREEAKRLEDAGCFAVVLELVTPETSSEISAALAIPTIGIGAGTQCDGQILVLQDMLGMNLDFTPKFLKHFARLEETVVEAVNVFCAEVTSGVFPK